MFNTEVRSLLILPPSGQRLTVAIVDLSVGSSATDLHAYNPDGVLMIGFLGSCTSLFMPDRAVGDRSTARMRVLHIYAVRSCPLVKHCLDIFQQLRWRAESFLL